MVDEKFLKKSFLRIMDNEEYYNGLSYEEKIIAVYLSYKFNTIPLYEIDTPHYNKLKKEYKEKYLVS